MQEDTAQNTEDDQWQVTHDHSADQFAGRVTEGFADTKFGTFADDLGAGQEDLGQDDDEACKADEDRTDRNHGGR